MGFWGPIALYVKVPLMWLFMAIFATGPIIERFTWPRIPGLVGPKVELCTVRWYESEDAKYPNREGPMDCAAAKQFREANPQFSYRTSMHNYTRVIYQVPGEARTRERQVEKALRPNGTTHRRGETMELVLSPSGNGFAKPVPRFEDWWYILLGVGLPPLVYLYLFIMWLRRRNRYAY